MSKTNNELLKYRKFIHSLEFSNLNDDLKLKHLINYSHLCYGYRDFNDCWKYYKYKLFAKNKILKYPKSLLNNRHKIKLLENINDLSSKSLLLIWDDGGFGDLILHSRLLKLLPKNINFKIKLRNDFRWIFKKYQDKFIEDDTIYDFDYHISFIQLENLFKFQLKKYNFKFDYLIKNNSSIWKNYFKKFEKQKKIGLVIKTDASVKKSINFEYFIDFLEENKKHNFFLIDLKPCKKILQYSSKNNNLIILDYIDQKKPFFDTYSILSNFDLLISIDTAVAHLAGYLNLKTILLLPKPPHYYWGVSDKSSIYYDNFYLIRSLKKDEWQDSIDELKLKFSDILS